MHPNRSIIVGADDRKCLERLAPGRNAKQKRVCRVWSVLLSTDRVGVKAFARHTKKPRPMVWHGRMRCSAEERDGLLDGKTHQPGRPPIPEEARKEVMRLTQLTPPRPMISGVSAEVAATPQSIGQRVWQAHGLRAHKSETPKLLTEPECTGRVKDMVGLWIESRLPVRPMTHDHKPDEVDNYATPKHAKVREWWAASPRGVLRFALSSRSRLSTAEGFFAALAKGGLGASRSSWSRCRRRRSAALPRSPSESMSGRSGGMPTSTRSFGCTWRTLSLRLVPPAGSDPWNEGG